MKWLTLILVLAIFLPLGAQLRTRYTPLPTVARRYAIALVFPRTMVRFEVVRR
jgi:hypothetical protein